MLNKKICKKREELNKSIAENMDYSIIYKISVELDDLIAEYYRKTQENREKNLYLVKKLARK